MAKKLIVIGLLLIPFLLSGGTSQAQIPTQTQSLDPTPYEHKEIIESKKLDLRAEVLKNYLAKYNSPLQYHAADFVEAADTYDLDWRLVPSISGVESTFGKRTPGNQRYPSYNAWGWGVYGTQALHFKSWREGIFTVSEGLKTRYVDRGYKTPLEMNRIYAASPVWGSHVNFFLADIRKFENDFLAKSGIVDLESPDTKPSAQITENTQ